MSKLDVFRLTQPGTEAVGTVAICTRGMIRSATAISMMLADFSFLKPNESVSRFIIEGHVLTMQRNEAVRRMEGDWLLFIDDDMVWQPSDIARIVARREEYDCDVLGGLCHQRGAPYQATIYMREQEHSGSYTFIEKWDDDEIIECDATGMAFCIIHRRVFDRMLGKPLPSYEERDKKEEPPFFTWGKFGEDLSFCQMAKETGSRIWVDTSIKIGHITDMVVTTKSFLHEVAVRGEEVSKVRYEQLASIGMGDRWLSPEEALEREKLI